MADIVLDLGDEDGRWVGCEGHVDVGVFLVALRAFDLANGHDPVPHEHPPQHAYMVSFFDGDDYWFQLDATHPNGHKVIPITILSLHGDPLAVRQATPADEHEEADRG